jgi:hypothetical protein
LYPDSLLLDVRFPLITERVDSLTESIAAMAVGMAGGWALGKGVELLDRSVHGIELMGPGFTHSGIGRGESEQNLAISGVVASFSVIGMFAGWQSALLIALAASLLTLFVSSRRDSTATTRFGNAMGQIVRCRTWQVFGLALVHLASWSWLNIFSGQEETIQVRERFRSHSAVEISNSKQRMSSTISPQRIEDFRAGFNRTADRSANLAGPRAAAVRDGNFQNPQAHSQGLDLHFDRPAIIGVDHL